MRKKIWGRKKRGTEEVIVENADAGMYLNYDHDASLGLRGGICESAEVLRCRFIANAAAVTGVLFRVLPVRPAEGDSRLAVGGWALPVVDERGRVDEEAIFGSVVDPFLDDVRAPDARFLLKFHGKSN